MSFIKEQVYKHIKYVALILFKLKNLKASRKGLAKLGSYIGEKMIARNI
jgi:hypothetical protein